MACPLLERMGLFSSKPEPPATMNIYRYNGQPLGAVLKTFQALKYCINIIPLKENDVYRHKPRTLPCATIVYNATTTRVKMVYVD